MSDPLASVGPLLVMGVSGVGKTTVGRALAVRLSREFLDADDFHSMADRRKMASGQPLTEADRGPWLERLADRLRRAEAARREPVLACSALTRASHATLRRSSPRLRVVFLRANPELIAERLRARLDHFMPPRLLESQLRTLQAPRDAVVIDASRSVATIVEQIVDMLTR